MVFLEYVLAFIVVVGILVFVHELGHFLAARWTGMRAEVFAVGMGPRLFGWNRKTGFTFGKLPEGLELGEFTDYRISALPLGGYVKILGMVDESMDADYATREPQPWEFRSKNTFQKALVISAGVIMNIILAILVFTGMNYAKGKDVVATTVVGPIPVTSPAAQAGLLQGDRILAVDGEHVDYFEDVRQKIAQHDAGKDLTFSVDRAGAPTTVTIPQAKLPSDPTKWTLSPDKMFVAVNSVATGSPAEKAGILAKDEVVAVDGTPLADVDQFRSYVGARKGQKIDVTVNRDGSPITRQVTVGSDGIMGVEIHGDYRGPQQHIDYGVLEALSAGWKETMAVTAGTFGLVGKLLTGGAKLKDSVGGPMMIAKVAREYAVLGLAEFFRLIAALSVTLACMNILPIPALDGGHLVFILIEGITRREVPLKIRMAVQQVGVALIIIFMAFVLINDSSKLDIFKH
ncbi:MAG: rseP [Chlorobi bacterium]|nr:rseP [Chlorobiota bacterium]